MTLQQARDSILDVTTPYDSFRFNGAVVVDTDALEQDSLVNPDSQSGYVDELCVCLSVVCVSVPGFLCQ